MQKKIKHGKSKKKVYVGMSTLRLCRKHNIGEQIKNGTFFSSFYLTLLRLTQMHHYLVWLQNNAFMQ